MIRLGEPEAEIPPALPDGFPKMAALLPDERTQAGQQFGFAEQIAQLVVPFFEQIFADVGQEVEMAGEHRDRGFQ